jgi:hypothetical protein
VAALYWGTREIAFDKLSQDEREVYAAPFYDAAWSLCRKGVLRPGAAVPAGQRSENQLGLRVGASPFFGDGYSLTTWGHDWTKKTLAERGAMPSEPARLLELLQKFSPKFGRGFEQRAAEAVTSWRTGNYLSTCTMAGAAAESILLATAIAKLNDEAAVLNQYRTASGRARVIKIVAAGQTQAMADRFAGALGVIGYWRDEAGHGTASSIGEIEAHEALSSLLRLARFTADAWEILIK